MDFPSHSIARIAPSKAPVKKRRTGSSSSGRSIADVGGGAMVGGWREGVRGLKILCSSLSVGTLERRNTHYRYYLPTNQPRACVCLSLAASATGVSAGVCGQGGGRQKNILSTRRRHRSADGAARRRAAEFISPRPQASPAHRRRAHRAAGLDYPH